MFYKDLTYHRYQEEGRKKILLFPACINIGWLDCSHSFVRGHVSEPLMVKLKQLTLLRLRKRVARLSGDLSYKSVVAVHADMVRGLPYQCSFCKREIEVELEMPEGEGGAEVLGQSLMLLPSVVNGKFYSFPDLLYHYIECHEYLPPEGFLEALEAFDMNQPFDAESVDRDVGYKRVTLEELRRLDAECAR